MGTAALWESLAEDDLDLEGDWLEEFGPAGAQPLPAAGPPAAPTPFPRVVLDAAVELLLSGVWTDITSQVYERDAVEVTRGRANEATLVDPSRVGLTLNNRNGQFSPRNPRSAYYGLIGRNTQLRVSVRPHAQTGPAPDITDTFGRTVPDTNWGICDSGKSWPAFDLRAPVGLRTIPSVDGSTGQMAIQVNSQANGVYLADCAWVDFELLLTFTAPVPTGGDIAGAGIATHVAADGSSTGPYVEVVVTRVAGQVIIRAFHSAGTTAFADSGFVAGLVHTGQPLRVRVRTAGLHLLARVWDPAGAEPATWHLVTTDSTAYDPGSIGVFARALAGNTNAKPLAVAFDDLSIEAVEPRACGEVAAWPARWTPGGLDVWSPVEAYGILRRLGQGKGKTDSAMARYVTGQAAAPAAYWPCEDGPLAGRCAAAVGPYAAVITAAPGSAVSSYLSKGSLGAWMPAVLAPNDTMQLYCKVRQTAGLTHWAVDWVRSGAESASESAMVIRTASRQWEVRFNPSTNLIKVMDPGASITSTGAGTFFDGDPHHVRFDIQNNGGAGTHDWTLYVDGVSYGTVSYTLPAGADPTEPIVYVKFIDKGNHTTDLALGHIVVWDATIPTAATAATAALGHDAEPAAVRIARLCAEEGIALRVPGPPGVDLTTSYPCGVQRTVPVLELLRAAEATDGGVLYEPRDFAGLAYRMRAQMYSQTPAVELDYPSAGNVAHPLEPLPDDAATRNDVTVTRRFGGSAQVEQTTGPLSVSDPPAGVGRYDTSVDLDLTTDAAATDQAAWRVHLGTVDEDRYPRVSLNLSNTAAHSLVDLLAATMRADLGDRLAIARPPAWLSPAVIDQLVQGYAETLDAYLWTLAANCSPALPWAIATVESGDEFCFRLETDGSTLAAGATDTATSLSVASTGTLWTTSAAHPDDFPFDVNIAGVRVTVTDITGAASPQTFTVVRSVDGFDVPLPAGATVKLWRPVYLGL